MATPLCLSPYLEQKTSSHLFTLHNLAILNIITQPKWLRCFQSMTELDRDKKAYFSKRVKGQMSKGIKNIKANALDMNMSKGELIQNQMRCKILSLISSPQTSLLYSCNF